MHSLTSLALTALVAVTNLASPTEAAQACSTHRRFHAKTIASAAYASSNSSAQYSSQYNAWSSAQATVTSSSSNPSSTREAGAASSSGGGAWYSNPKDASSSTSASASWSQQANATVASDYPSSSSYANVTSSSGSSSSSNSSISWGLPSGGIKVNAIAIGMLPDDGSGGGTAQTMAELNSAMGMTSSAYGYYAQAQSGTDFDGSQLKNRLDDILAAGGVFQPAIMPTGGWKGLTYDDNSQAINIANVMKYFLDQGVEEIWLRFAHEVNYYQTDGTYQGDASDFKEAWAVVYAALQDIAPAVKLWFTPNVSDESDYDSYFPDDPSTVALIGIDYYPSSLSDNSFLDKMQAFHDKYCDDSRLFAIGEIGLGYAGAMSDRLSWLKQMTSTNTKSSMQYLTAISWFNYYKGYDFRIAGVTGASDVYAYLGGSS